MSHYQVMAIVRKGGPGLEELMEPYSEHLSVAPYVSKTKAELIRAIGERISQARADRARIAEAGYESKFDRRWLLEDPWGIKFSTQPEGASDEELYMAFRGYWGKPEDFDAEGNLLSTYNPEARWDYWSEGSYLTFVLKDGTYEDPAFAKDVDWAATSKPARGEKAQLLREWRHLALGKVPGGLKGQELEEWLDREYGSFRYRTGYLKEAYGSFERFAEVSCAFKPYAIVGPDGWKAPGRVGWFGASTETGGEWIRWVTETIPGIIASLRPDDELHLLDCHI